ncbi:MAG TPA: ATP-binding protein [bacterium]|nr:ATP-binding protein [bacterium]
MKEEKRQTTTIAVASGKGGTGKTTVAVNLALTFSRAGKKTLLLDCDVEAPNAHIFLGTEGMESSRVTVRVPVVDESKCDACGACGKACRFSAIVSLGGKALTFPSLCHACGGCVIACPTKAISEGEREIGAAFRGMFHGVDFAYGKLRIGEAMSPPLIRVVKKFKSDAELTIVDSPPGTSCPVVQSVRGSDYVALVTEPTPFGLHDLKLAVEMIREIGIPFGCIVNRAEAGDRRAHDFCLENDIPVIGAIPDDRRAAEAYSRGIPLIDALPDFKLLFEELGGRLIETAEACARKEVRR